MHVSQDPFNPLKCTEIGVMWGKEDFKSLALEAEYHSCKHYDDKYNSEEHLAQYVKMLSKSKKTGVLVFVSHFRCFVMILQFWHPHVVESPLPRGDSSPLQ